MRIHNYATVRREMPEGAIMTRIVTYLMIFGLLAIFAHFTERDSHPFNEPVVTVQSWTKIP